jgi:hypothetical protein
VTRRIGLQLRGAISRSSPGPTPARHGIRLPMWCAVARSGALPTMDPLLDLQPARQSRSCVGTSPSCGRYRRGEIGADDLKGRASPATADR